MRTLVALENSNCTWCNNDMLGALRERSRVQAVGFDSSAGCLVIEHEENPDSLVSLIRTEGRAVAVAANGERVMVSVDAHEAADCQVSKDTVIRAQWDEEEESSTGHATSRTGPGAAGRTASLPTGIWPSEGTLCPVCLTDPGSGRRHGGREGVRVLTRERPAPGLLLGAVRVLASVFRGVFRVPSVAR